MDLVQEMFVAQVRKNANAFTAGYESALADEWNAGQANFALI